jgi:hypothetical protein
MNRLHLFNHAVDAWEYNLAGWLEQRSVECLSGKEAWFVTGSYMQANWLRRMTLSEGKALFGIRFFDVRLLRQHLSKLFCLPSPSFGYETLRILLEAAALENEYTATSSLLDALDDLAASGWLVSNGLDAAFRALRIPEYLEHAVRQLTGSEYWRPRVDLVLLERAVRNENLSLGVYGLDAENFKDLNLLLAAARGAARSDFWFAQPLGKEGAAFQWIATLERELMAEASVCPAGNASRPYENFLAHWQGRGERNVKSPEILVANRWHEQVEGVVAHVCRALTRDAKDVLVVAPEGSATGRELVHQLVSRGIAVVDEFREMTLPSPLLQIQITIARYFAEEEAPELFLRIVEGLLRSPKRFKEFRDAVFGAFDDLQTRSATRLITEQLRERFAWLVDLESSLGAWPHKDWPHKDKWETLQQRWELLLDRVAGTCAKYPGELIQLTWSIVELEPLWHEVAVFLEGRTVSVRLFLKYLCELLSAQARRPHPGSHHRYAKVVVAPPSKAHATSWDYVILTDAISDGWTRPPVANSVLNDEQRMRFRRDGFFLAVASEKRQVQQERTLQLAYHARKHLVLARYERDEKGIETGANDLGTFAEEFLKAKVTRIHGPPKTDFQMPLFATIWSNRLNPELPFDEYFLNFRGAGLAAAPWHPSALETVFKTPATFAFKAIYGCQREFDRAFFRSAQMTVGRIAHRWLQSAFGKNARFASFCQAPLRVTDPANALFRSELELAYLRTRSETPGPDLWWETILNKAFSLALRMLERACSYFDPHAHYQSEGELEGTWHSAEGDLALNGRTDLILSDLAQLENASVRIVDFKTSKRVRAFDQENGDGLQFLGYQLLAKVNGARKIELIVVTPDQSKPISLPSDADLASVINLLAFLQTSQSFGRRPNVKWDVAETLPIATVPISSEILERKLALTWERS